MVRRLANVVFLLGLLPWLLVFLLGIMAFDAPSSEQSPLTLGLFYSILTYPILVLVGFFGSSGFWGMKDPLHWRRHLAFLPAVSVVAAVAFWFAIDSICGGQFACKP